MLSLRLSFLFAATLLSVAPPLAAQTLRIYHIDVEQAGCRTRRHAQRPHAADHDNDDDAPA
jgi:hypothetical protein